MPWRWLSRRKFEEMAWKRPPYEVASWLSRSFRQTGLATDPDCLRTFEEHAVSRAQGNVPVVTLPPFNMRWNRRLRP
jgi:hypothetical protein